MDGMQLWPGSGREKISENVRKFRELVVKVAETYERKNADYGDSYSDTIYRYGFVAGIVRMHDKFQRAENLLLRQKEVRVNDESAVDTLLDLAAYAIMTAMEVNKVPSPENKMSYGKTDKNDER